jgi:hypothetical protein
MDEVTAEHGAGAPDAGMTMKVDAVPCVECAIEI